MKPLAPPDAARLAQLATQQHPLPPHVLDVVAKRSGGNPQFLRDLLRTAIESGGVEDLPDSAEAAAMTQIDTLAPDDRAMVRRAAVLGMTFHPRMLAWLYGEDEGPPPGEAELARLGEMFEVEPDGYLRFRHSLLRDSAYQGLPFKLRRQLHGAVARHLEEEMDFPEEAGEHAVAALFRSRRISSRRGAMRRPPQSARKAFTPTSKLPGCIRVRLRPGARSRALERLSSPPRNGRWATRGIGPASSPRRQTPTWQLKR